jgi:hypothetical protein
LAALCSPEWSEQLRSLYESIAGVPLDPWWDLYALLHHDDSQPKWMRGQVAGRRPVDAPGMTSRVEAAIETALRASDNCSAANSPPGHSATLLRASAPRSG